MLLKIYVVHNILLFVCYTHTKRMEFDEEFFRYTKKN